VSIPFYGSWSLNVLSKEALFEERATIIGSQNSDGVVPGVPGNSVASIEGDAWEIEMEWSSDGGANWYPSRIHRLPGVVPGKGLIVTLAADDNTPQLADGDFNDLILELVYLNPVVNPPGGGLKPYEFTAPEGSYLPKPLRPPEKNAGGCCCACGCQHGAAARCRC
jgi:hypothetical protein